MCALFVGVFARLGATMAKLLKRMQTVSTFTPHDKKKVRTPAALPPSPHTSALRAPQAGCVSCLCPPSRYGALAGDSAGAATGVRSPPPPLPSRHRPLPALCSAGGVRSLRHLLSPPPCPVRHLR